MKQRKGLPKLLTINPEFKQDVQDQQDAIYPDNPVYPVKKYYRYFPIIASSFFAVSTGQLDGGVKIAFLMASAN